MAGSSFIEKLRAPRFSGSAGGGAGTGMPDTLAQMALLARDQMSRDSGRGGGWKRGSGFGGGSRYMGRPHDGDGMPGFNSAAMNSGGTGAPIGSNGRPMDVVYDQRPEMFAKEMKMKERLAEQGQKNLDREYAANQDNTLRAETQANRNRELAGRDLEYKREILQNPNLEFKDAGGEYYGFNPRTGEAHATGAKSGTMTDKDKLDTAGRNSLAVAEANARARANAAQTSGDARIKAAEIAAAGRGGNESASDQNMRFRQFLNQNPGMEDYVTYENGGYRVNPPSDTVEPKSGAPDMDTWRKLNKALAGVEGPVSDVHGGNAPLMGAGGSAGLQRKGAMGSGSLGMPRTDYDGMRRPGDAPDGTGLAPRGGIRMTTPDGRSMTVPTQAEADRLEQLYGAKRVAQ